MSWRGLRQRREFSDLFLGVLVWTTDELASRAETQNS
jgi:hypothetical protein